jgi:hypothetical protein
VDLIVEPGAGGQLIRMVESFNQEEQDMKLRKDMLDTIQQKAPKASRRSTPRPSPTTSSW